MPRTGLILLTAFVTLGPGSAAAQEAYTIKVKKPAQGSTILEEQQEEKAITTKVVDNNQTVLSAKDDRSNAHFVYRETILEKKGDERATRLRREYRKAAAGKGKETVTLSLEGKTVLIEKKKDRYEFQVEGGGELTEQDRKELDAQFNTKDNKPAFDPVKMMLPDRAVKVGEAWQMDRDLVAKGFAQDAHMEVDREKVKATGRLVRAYKKDGKQFGVIELEMRVPVLAMVKEGKCIPLQPGALMKLSATVDGCIDGTAATNEARLAITMNLQALIPDPDQPKATLTLNISLTGTNRTVEEK